MSSQLFLSYEVNNKPQFTELTCTSEVSVNFKNKVSSFPVESGSYISDHVSNSPVEITFTGVVSDIFNYSLDYGDTVENTIKTLKALRDSNTPFTVSIADNLDSYSNCVFTDFMISQSSGKGTSWDVRLGMVQIQIGSASSLETYPDNEIKDQHAAKNNQGSNATEEDSSFFDRITLTPRANIRTR